MSCPTILTARKLIKSTRYTLFHFQNFTHSFRTTAAQDTKRPLMPNTHAPKPAKTPLSECRPGLFTQQIILTNGATYKIRSTSPKPVIKLVKDTRNHPLWNPESRDGIHDESGQLSKFHKKFGDSEYDLEFMESEENVPELTASDLKGMTKVKPGKGKKK
ncbi:hypothetical protein G9A89_022044 [Geosiphon pyriformis]|nr:hypothetical protein G9A89_022044 [Geosiphon pyriformis]